MNILFWNTCLSYKNKDNIEKARNVVYSLLEMIAENRVDLLVLAEYERDINKLCNLLNSVSDDVKYRVLVGITCKRIKVIINEKYNCEVLRGRNHYLITKITTDHYELLIAMIHAISKRDSTVDKQVASMASFHNKIRECEKEQNCQNTLVIGDFNINPFEAAFINANTMHAIPFREEVIKSPTRICKGKEYYKFYNPTWKFLGNKNVPYTTYYYNNSGDVVNYYWNAFDQVIIRPSLIEAFDEEQLKIVTKTKNHCLLKKGKPDKINYSDYSDHLPLYCVLREELI
ncbi:MAG: hypothetical protein FWD01_03740 [Defluviitaleaceae bacterium]|nr:hypothetical protein [Defluviitaleaceae bacterium]